MRLDEHGTASYGDVQMCARIHACPVCSARIRQERALELEAAALRHTDLGGGLAFGTFTIPHNFGDNLQDTLQAIKGTWKRTRENRAVRRLWKRLGLRGLARTFEITYGANGWHPHIHVLYFAHRTLTAEELTELGDVLHAAWATAAQAMGLRMPTRAHGVRVQGIARDGRGASALAGYLTKVQDGYGSKSRSVGSEMTRGDLKQGREGSSTPFELLDKAAAGFAKERRLWQEYERATTGLRCIEATPGLLRDLGVDELDDQAAADKVESVAVLLLSDAQWRAVLGQTYGRRRLLEMVEADLAYAMGWLFTITRDPEEGLP